MNPQPVAVEATCTVSAEQPSISQKLSEFVTATTYEKIPERVRERAKLHILDVIGSALAATRSDFSRCAAEGLQTLAEPGRYTVLGMPLKLQVRDAVLLNGILAHGLDYDDTHPGAIVHPSCTTFPCVLGVSEQIDAHGRDALAAYVLGVDVATRVGLAARHRIHQAGFHTTGIAGHLGCVIAASKLYAMDADQITHAQGLAGSTASGVCEHRADGAWNKRMHPGWAGVGAITAAALARGGFIGTRKIYEGADGIFRTHTGQMLGPEDLAEMTRGLGERWLIEEAAVKPFPICHLLHACADSALALRKKHNIESRDIREVRGLLHPDIFRNVCEPPEMRRRPASEYMAKFSMQFVVASCLVRGKFGYAELEPDALNDPQILALAQRVRHEADPESEFPKYFSGGVVVKMNDGRELRHLERINRGAGERTLTADEIVAKFMDNAELMMARGRAMALRDCVLSLDQNPMSELSALLAG